MVKITRDTQSDSIYIETGRGKASRAVELHPNVALDMAEDGTVTGISIQRLSAPEEGLDEALSHVANEGTVIRVENIQE